MVSGYPWLLWGLLAAWAAAACACASGVKELLTRRGWAIALLLVLGGAGLRLSRPAVHQVYFDEYEHVDIASTLARKNVFAEHLAGGLGDVDILSAPTWPGLHHGALSLVMKFAGGDESSAYAFNTVMAVLSILAIILFGASLFEDEPAGLAAGAFWAALPLHVQFSRASDLTASSLFWAACALLALVLDERGRSPRQRLLLLVTLACACHSRFENALLLPVSAAYLHWRGAPLRQAEPAMRAATALFFLTLLPIPLLAWNNRLSGLPGFTASPAQSLSYFLCNAPENALFFFRRAADALLLIACALYGLDQAQRRQWGRYEAGLLLFWGGACFLLYGSFFRGQFGISSESRYSLSIYLPLIVLAGFGVSALARRFAEPLFIPLLAAAGFLSLSWPGYRAQAAGSHEEEYRFILDAAPLLPTDLYTVSFSPSAILAAAGRPALSPYLLDERAVQPGLAKGLVLFKDYWWHQRAAHAAKLQERLSRDYDSAMIAERSIDGKTYGFYRLTPKSGVKRGSPAR